MEKGMKIGKVPETVLKRSVLKYVRQKNQNEIPPAVGNDAGVFVWNDRSTAVSTQTVIGEGIKTGELAVLRAINSVVASGAVPKQVTLAVTVPETMLENALRQLMSCVQNVCQVHNVIVAGGHTTVSKEVSEPIVCVTALGVVEQIFSKQDITGAKIVMTKWCGMCGTALLAERYEEALCTRYTKRFIGGAKTFWKQLSVQKEAMLARNFDVLYMHDASEGGIFGALWELGEQADCGMDITIRKIPMRQETVEICEYFDCNPYQLRAEGSLLLVTRHAEELCEHLKKEGIPATVIGTLKEGRERRIWNEEEVRFLEPNRVEEYDSVRYKNVM